MLGYLPNSLKISLPNRLMRCMLAQESMQNNEETGLRLVRIDEQPFLELFAAHLCHSDALTSTRDLVQQVALLALHNGASYIITLLLLGTPSTQIISIWPTKNIKTFHFYPEPTTVTSNQLFNTTTHRISLHLLQIYSHLVFLVSFLYNDQSNAYIILIYTKIHTMYTPLLSMYQHKQDFRAIESTQHPCRRKHSAKPTPHPRRCSRTYSRRLVWLCF